MTLTIGSRSLQLLELHPDYSALPFGQAQAYRLLMSLDEGHYAEQAIASQVGLRSPLPLWSWIGHLSECGLIRLLVPVPV